MRVLYADDDAIARTLLAAVLADLGHDAMPAEDGAQAWELFQAEPVPLVILDINMPGMDGRAFRKVQAGDPELADVPVIALTGNPHIEEEARQLRVRDYLLKPVDPDKLLGLIALHCDR